MKKLTRQFSTKFSLNTNQSTETNVSFLLALTNNFKNPRLFPVLWVEESVELSDELVDMIKSDLLNVLRLVDILMWTFVGIGAALIVGMLIWFFIARNARKKRVVKTQSVDPIVKD